ncbi:MAG: MerR family transcriptional regulator [Salinisphaera sp.]|nr:MerR family transcriptional regulator [Salinisphaera sp.]
MNEQYVSIGQAARASGLSVKAIRYYEQIGLIPPPRRHDCYAQTGGNRVFSAADLKRLHFIHHARLLELGLDEVRDLLNYLDAGYCPGGQDEYQTILRRHLQKIDERVEHLLGLRRRIEALAERKREDRPRACTSPHCGCLEPVEIPAATTPRTQPKC